MNNYKSLLTALTQSYAVSGYEWELGITKTLQKSIGSLGKRIGDNLVYQFGIGEKKIMLSAHMDEVGFFITHVKKDFIKIMPIGDVAVENVFGKKLVFYVDNKVAKTYKVKKTKSFTDLNIYGLKDAKIGSVGTFEKSIRINDKIIEATSLDNKVGCAVLVEITKELQRKKPNKSIFICFACREEASTNGLMHAVKKIDPDICVDIDSAYAKPITSVKKKNWRIPQIGKGPAIQLMGNGFIVRASDRRLIETVCKKNRIPYQYEIPDGNYGGTNASKLIDAGFETLQINIPVANQHSAVSIASLNDIAMTTKLIKNLLAIL